MGPRPPACAKRARLDMPKISHVKLEYTIYEGDHRKPGRYFGLVHRGPLRLFHCTIEDAANKSEALETLKRLYAESKIPVTTDPAVHHWHD